MKKRLCLALALCLLLLFGCEPVEEPEVGTVFKPMVFVNGSLYGENGHFRYEPPEGAVLLGEVETVVSATEPMVREELHSNCLPAGTRIYQGEGETDKVYLESDGPNGPRYLMYTLIPEEGQKEEPEEEP